MTGISSLFDLSGRRIWVFGGAGYLGRAVVSALDAHGAEIACLDLPGRAVAFLAEGNLSSRVAPHDIDIVDTQRIAAWIQKESDLGCAPDGAVFMTSPLSATPLEQLDREELRAYNDAGLGALFCTVRDTGLAMLHRSGGSLVMFSSMYGEVAPDPAVYHAPMAPNPIHYGMQKAAIIQMTRYLAASWGSRGVRCNSVAPGPFPASAVQTNHPDFVARLAAKCPMGRIGQAPEIAGAVVFLLSDASTYVNGHNLVVDGGWTAW